MPLIELLAFVICPLDYQHCIWANPFNKFELKLLMLKVEGVFYEAN